MLASPIQTERLDRCPICSGSPRALIRTVDFESGTGAYGIDACTDCGVAFTNPRPLDSELWKLYESRETADFAPRAVSLAGVMRGLLMRRRLLRALGGTTGETFRLLDYGCGDGSLVAAGAKLAARRGFKLEFTGVDFHDEPPPTIAPLADGTSYLSAQAWGGTTDRYDHIFIRHVLEHHSDPARLLRTLAERLRPGGTLHIEVPNRRSIWARIFGRYFFPYYVPRHLYHFDAESLRHVVDKAELRTRSLDFGHTPVIGKSLAWRYSVDIDNLGMLGLASFPLQVAMDVLARRSTTLVVKACRE